MSNSKTVKLYGDTGKGLENQLKYHYHMNKEEQEIMPFRNNEMQSIDMAEFPHRGLPGGNNYIASQIVFYNSETKTWTCAICNHSLDKYNWEQIVTHVNSKHGKTKPKGTNEKDIRG